MKISISLLILVSFCIGGAAQQPTQNVLIVTLDGMRWQEVFGGADSALIHDGKYTGDVKRLSEKFWANRAEDRRAMLFPFLWNTVKNKGRIYGNRSLGNNVNVANGFHMSYPGYSEIFTGYPDPRIRSNDKIPNPNETVLEFLGKQAGFTGKVAAFASWDVFPYILNKWRSGIFVNADIDTLPFSFPVFTLLNEMQFLTTKPIGVRPDLLTYFSAREYLKKFTPRVLFIGLDETDDYAHRGEYDHYLESAHEADAMLADLWQTVQGTPQYRNHTTLIITCDHGRGDRVRENWKNHESGIVESGETWLAVIGPGIDARGEVRTPGQIFQEQIAATVASLLGLKFTASHPVADAIRF